MKKFIFMYVMLHVFISHAQVGINTLTPKASLDVEASNVAAPLNTDGILIPRVNAFPAVNPGADQNAMLIYLNVVSGTNAVGFYYWNNATTAWLPFGGGTTTSGWDLLGNAGTASGTNFLGTTDNQALDFRTDNLIRARITTKGQIEVFNTGNSVFVGEGAGAADDLSNRNNVFVGKNSGANISTGAATANDGAYNVGVGGNTLNAATTGRINVAVGYGALENLTTGFGNTVFGFGALDRGTTATDNVAIGQGALTTATGTVNKNVIIGQNAFSASVSSFENVGIGNHSGAFNEGEQNVFVGVDSDRNNSGAGNRNTILGARAGKSSGSTSSLSGRVMIGYEAGLNVAGNNKLYLENSSSVTPLVYGEFDNDILRVGGQLQIGSSDDATAGSIYAFPTVDGTTGQALITDGAGNVSWGTVSGGGADTQDLSIDNTNATVSLVDGGSVIVSTIADADADTKIQVEESADEDIIRFDAGGTEHFTMNNRGQLQVLNTGRSVFIGDGAGDNDDLANRDNVFVGNNAGNASTTGAANVAIGPNALAANTTGGGSIAIGNSTLAAAVSSSNIAIGNSALANGTNPATSVGIGTSALLNSNGGFNTAVGNFALANSYTGDQNTALGTLSGANLNGSNNIALGFKADQFNHNGDRNIVIGSEAGMLTGGGNDNNGNVLIGHNAAQNIATNNALYLENSSSVTPLIYGEFDNNIVRIGGQLQVGSSDDATPGSVYAFPTTDGTAGQVLTTDGAGVVSWGAGGSSSDSDWFAEGTTASPTAITDNIFTNGNVGIGDSTPDGNLDIESEGDAIIILNADTDNANEADNPSLQLIQDGGFIRANIELGGDIGASYPSSGQNDLLVYTRTNASDIQFAPNRALALTLGVNSQARLNAYTTATSFTGTATSILAVDAAGNIIQEPLASGGADTQDLSINNTTADLSLVDGGTVKLSTIADADSDTKIQVEESADEDVIRFDIGGTEHFTMDASGHFQVFNSSNSVFIGEGAGVNDDLANRRNVYIGENAGNAGTTSQYNSIVGYNAKGSSATGNYNSIMGYEAGRVLTGDYNAIIGMWSGRNITGDQNVVLGAQSGNFTGGDFNVAIGAAALAGYGGTVTKTVAVGKSSLDDLENGNENTALGYNSLSDCVTCNENIAIGSEAATSVFSNSTRNIFIGNNSGGATLFDNSILIGHQAGSFSGATASNRLVIENSAGSTALIGGDFDTNKVGINVNLATAGALSHTLTVGGDVKATNYLATASNTNYADYVFENYFGKEATINTKYNFTPLKEAVKFVEENGHLPNVKSYKEIKANNFEISLKETSLKNLEKIEENFLYIKEINEKNEVLEKENKDLKSRTKTLEENNKTLAERLERLEKLVLNNKK